MDAAAFDRRRLLTGGAALGGLALLSARPRGAVRAWAAPLLEGPPRTLVLLQLSGGNDGLNTLVPHGDPRYYAARPVLAVPKADVLALDAYVGLHPALAGLAELHAAGRLAIVQGAGYPEPNRSHFEALEIWHTARRTGRDSGDGWIGRVASEMFGATPNPNGVVHVGTRPPYSLHSSTHPAAAFATAAGYGWAGDRAAIERAADECDPEAAEEDGNPALARVRAVVKSARASSHAVREATARYRPRAAYPDGSELGGALFTVAALMQAEIGTRVFSVELDGFDTHNDQIGRHPALLRDLDRCLTAFLRDVEGTPAGDRTLVLVFSEFGRRVAENASRGTDHGTAAPLLLAGAPVKGGLHGAHPALADLDEQGDLVFTTDFRAVYAELIEDWLGADAERVLGERFAKLGLLRS